MLYTLRVSLRSLLTACLAFGLVLGVSSSASGQVDAALLKRAKAGNVDVQFDPRLMYHLGIGVAERGDCGCRGGPRG